MTDTDAGSRRKRIALITIAAIVLVWVGWSLIRSWTMSEEAKIRRVLEEIRLAVEGKSARDVAAHIAPDYSDTQGLTKQELRRTLAGFFLRSNRSMACVLVPDSIEVAEGAKEATVKFRAAVYEGISITELAGGGAAAARGQGFAFTVTMRKSADDGEWRVKTHTRKPFPANDIWRLAFGGGDGEE